MKIMKSLYCIFKNDKPNITDIKQLKRKYFLQYTLLFAAVALMVFSWYFLAGRTFIWQADGWAQHYKALVYYAKYLRSVIYDAFINRQFSLPEWDFALGEGNDILQALNYYVIGDPFSFFSVLVPTELMWIYYDLLIIVKLYLSGLAFSCLCFYTLRHKNTYAIMAGALSYAFCFWCILNANRHPCFLSPIMYFPLVILGVEKVVRRDRPYVLIISVFLSAISNFYYFYVTVMLTVVYAAVRLAIKYKKDIRAIIASLFRIAAPALLGALMGAVILFPVCFDFLSDARMSSGNAWHIVYPLSYYFELFETALSGFGSYWLCISCSAPVILASVLLFTRKGEHTVLKTCFAACSAVILIPALGQFLNGMSYMSNKWCWAFILLCTYIFALMWPELIKLKGKESRKLFVFLAVYFFALLILPQSRTLASFACLGIAFIFLFIVSYRNDCDTDENSAFCKKKQTAALCTVIAGIVCISFFLNSSDTEDYASEAKTVREARGELTQNESNTVAAVAGSEGVDGFYRYSGSNLTHNANTLSGISATSYFWSISNQAVAEYIREFELLETLPQKHTGYDDRTSLLTQSSVLYYVIPSNGKAPVPYGFTYVDTFNVKENITKEATQLLRAELGSDELSEEQIKIIEDSTSSYYSVYRNSCSLPPAYTYDSIITKKKWNTLSSVEKQEAMLYGIYLEDCGEAIASSNYTSAVCRPDFTVEENSSGVTYDEDEKRFIVTSPKSSVTINFKGKTNSETYLSVRGLSFESVSPYDLYFGDEKYDPNNLFSKTGWDILPFSNRKKLIKEKIFWSPPDTVSLSLKASTGTTKRIGYYLEDYSYYTDRHDFTANLAYSEEAADSVTVTFSNAGIYSFDSLEITCLPMDGYKERISALKENTLENMTVADDIISGSIVLDKPEVLCLAVPFAEGWRAYVDGEQAEIYKANIKYMALVLDEGEHDIQLVYHTPYLREGAVVSAAALAVFIAYAVLIRRRKHTSKTKKDLQ